jgi:NAD(P)H-dependent FMN reductase
MRRLLREVEYLCEEIAASDHPHAQALYDELEANDVIIMAWPEPSLRGISPAPRGGRPAI